MNFSRSSSLLPKSGFSKRLAAVFTGPSDFGTLGGPSIGTWMFEMVDMAIAFLGMSDVCSAAGYSMISRPCSLPFRSMPRMISIMSTRRHLERIELIDQLLELRIVRLVDVERGERFDRDRLDDDVLVRYDDVANLDFAADHDAAGPRIDHDARLRLVLVELDVEHVGGETDRIIAIDFGNADANVGGVAGLAQVLFVSGFLGSSE